MKIFSLFCSVLSLCLMTGVAAAQPYTSELGNGLVITIQSLKRSGTDSVMLKGFIENTNPPGSERLSFMKCCATTHDIFRADLQDPVGKKQYGQITINRDAVGSRHQSSTYLSPKEKQSVWARITAPPADVEKITIVFPCSAPPIEDVPIQK